MFKEKLKLIPHLPGSYQMRDKDNIIIYVGKAKDLYKRVNSYFKGTVTGKTRLMVSEVKDFTYIVTSSEKEAFITEINLIKEYNPKYNILLKDDKSYPYIEYISKPYPKLIIVRYLRLKKKDNHVIFGPFPTAGVARRLVNLINRLYPLKKCNGNPKEVCLYYHINECLGYCSKLIDQDKLIKMEHEILDILKGNDKVLRDKLNEKIKLYSDNLNYEMAKELYEELKYLDILKDRQKVELKDYINRDIIGIDKLDNYVSISILFIRNNKLIGSHNEILKLKINYEEEVNSYIINFYCTHEIPKEILTNIDVSDVVRDIIERTIIIPKRGIKKDLVNMAITNARVYLKSEVNTIYKKESLTTLANEELRNILGLTRLKRIDAFDNSNLFGTFAVSGMVVFKDGVKSLKDYRKYKLRLENKDDYHMFRELILRRYKDKLDIPDLILVDGGEIQINATKEILDILGLDILVCGLKKNDKHSTNALINGKTMEVIPLNKDSNVFYYLTNIQDEVHRFTINYHKNLRSKGMLASVLDNVSGIGSERRKLLLKRFNSLNKLKEATKEELEEVLPKNIAKNLYDYLKNK